MLHHSKLPRKTRYCAPSITQAPQKRPQQQRVNAVVQRGNTVSRLDLSELFVDDLVLLLIFWRKGQLSRFAETVSQVLETGRLRVNRSKVEVLVGAAGPGARHINAEIARGAYQFSFRGETIRATTAVRYLGCQVASQGNTRAEAQMMVIKASKAQTRDSCGLWAPRVCTYHYINTHFFLYIRRHTYTHCINKGLRHILKMSAHQCSFYFFKHLPDHTNTYISFLCMCIYK